MGITFRYNPTTFENQFSKDEITKKNTHCTTKFEISHTEHETNITTKPNSHISNDKDFLIYKIT